MIRSTILPPSRRLLSGGLYSSANPFLEIPRRTGGESPTLFYSVRSRKVHTNARPISTQSCRQLFAEEKELHGKSRLRILSARYSLPNSVETRVHSEDRGILQRGVIQRMTAAATSGEGVGRRRRARGSSATWHSSQGMVKPPLLVITALFPCEEGQRRLRMMRHVTGFLYIIVPSLLCRRIPRTSCRRLPRTIPRPRFRFTRK